MFCPILREFNMARYFKDFIVFAVLLALCSQELLAQHQWAIAIKEKGSDNPTIMEYHSVAETAGNDVEYHRIVDDSYRFRKETYNPVKLRYGYRLADRQIYIYDYESQKEALAFDFNLCFTTYNGMEWRIEAVKDTLVNISFCGQGENMSKRLLSVRTPDGEWSDQWLEDFGSFTNHFMINSMDQVEWSQTLWMEYKMGEYLAREINSDPFFAHDSGWMDGVYSEDESTEQMKCYYENGQVVFETVLCCYEHRDYSCFYRNGDNINRLFNWELRPHVDSGTSAMRKDVIVFEGLPKPVNRNYSIIIGDAKYSTNISNVIMSHQHPQSPLFDLQGRRIQEPHQQGIYIKDGKKVVVR